MPKSIFLFRKKFVTLPQIYVHTMVVEIISKYLEANKRLIIPNLGAFIVKVPAQTILFSNLLKNDDGVLRSLLVQNGMSEIEAAGVVDRFVFEINYRLQSNGECRLGGFGRLVAGANGAVAFEYAPAIEGDDLEGSVNTPAENMSVESVASSVNVAEDVVADVVTTAEVAAEYKADLMDKAEPKQAATQMAKRSPKTIQRPVADATEDADDDDEQDSVEIEVTPRTQRKPSGTRRMNRDEVVYDGQRVSASSKMRPDDYVKGLRYGKGRKIVSGRESAMVRRSNKSDLIMKIAIAAALIAVAALAYGMWNDWRASRFDAEIYGEVPESAESEVRNPDLDYIEKKAQ